MNVPYVKQYKDGILINPIHGTYLNPFSNRRARKETRDRKWGGKKPKERFMGCGKNHSLTLNGAMKYRRIIQEVAGKRIEHYILQK